MVPHRHISPRLVSLSRALFPPAAASSCPHLTPRIDSVPIGIYNKLDRASIHPFFCKSNLIKPASPLGSDLIWTLAYTPRIWPCIFTVLLLLGLAAYAWRRRSVPGARFFMLGSLLGVLWAAGSAMEYAAVDLSTKILWIKFQAIWQLPSVTLITCFIVEYTWPGRWLTRRNLALLSIAPLLVFVLVLTNDTHHLMWTGFIFDGTVLPLRGLAIWILIAYAYGLGFIDVFVYIWLFLRAPLHRWPVAIMLFGLAVSRTLYILEKTYIIRHDLPLDILAIAFMYLIYAVALFGFRLFDPVPSATKLAIMQMKEGMLVLDPQGRVTSLNPAAQKLLGVHKSRALGQPVRELLPALAGPAEGPNAAGTSKTEISLKAGGEARFYSLEDTPLKDWRGLVTGSLLLLHDVTEQKQAERRHLEQTWAQATLQEREQLAGELHDGLSQNLAFLNLQAQAAQLYLQSGQSETARASLERLSEAAGQIQEDARELIDQLLTVSRPSDNFCAILRKMLAGFEGQTGLVVHLEVDEQLEGQKCTDPVSLTPPAAVQLVRITQEALVNVRKHARGASQVSVALNRLDGHLVLSIADDGQGFNPDDTTPIGKHFGLKVMRQRAARIGGRIAVDSAQGKGTRVEVKVPLNDMPAWRVEDEQ